MNSYRYNRQQRDFIEVKKLVVWRNDTARGQPLCAIKGLLKGGYPVDNALLSWWHADVAVLELDEGHSRRAMIMANHQNYSISHMRVVM